MLENDDNGINEVNANLHLQLAFSAKRNHKIKKTFEKLRDT